MHSPSPGHSSAQGGPESWWMHCGRFQMRRGAQAHLSPVFSFQLNLSKGKRRSRSACLLPSLTAQLHCPYLSAVISWLCQGGLLQPGRAGPGCWRHCETQAPSRNWEPPNPFWSSAQPHQLNPGLDIPRTFEAQELESRVHVAFLISPSL